MPAAGSEQAQSLLARRMFNPLEMLTLREAVKKRKQLVTLGDKTFRLTYENSETLWIQPTQGYAPCGRLSIKRLLEEL